MVFNDFKIVQITDLHNKSFGYNNEILINKIEKLNPDIIVTTGDIIDGDSKNYQEAYNLLKMLSEKYKVYYINGNHEQKVMIGRYKENYKSYFKKIKNLDIIDLNNSHIKIRRNNNSINLYGLELPFEYYIYLLKNTKDRKRKIEKRFLEDRIGQLNKNEYNILLSHNPFFFEEYAYWGADLVFAGHVHGGMIRIPGLGGLLSPTREFFPKYDWGQYNMNNSIMILSKGLGGAGPIPRIMCRPEIVCVTLKSINM